MLKVILCVGIVASGKSTWAKEEVKKDPTGTIRVNRDDLRIMMSNYVYSEDNEKLVVSIRDQIIISSLKRGKNVIIDDTNLNRRNFDDICKLVKSAGIDCMVMEKPFYVDLDEAKSRNAKREGFALIPEDVIEKMWKKSGGTGHKFYKGRIEMINSYNSAADSVEQNIDRSLPWAIICDLDGTVSLFNVTRKDGSIEVRHPGAPVRNPYDASQADNDMVNEPVMEVLERMSNAGYQVIFCSGRTEQYRSQTIKFLNKHATFPYQLIMRQSGDSRKDSVLKEELYQNNIAGRYNVFFVMDDRSSVVAFWRSKGFHCWQVNPGDF